MGEEIQDLVMYALALQNCRGVVRRFYYYASKEFVRKITDEIDRRSDDKHETIFEDYGNARVFYNPDWLTQDSLEFRATTRLNAVKAAKARGFEISFPDVVPKLIS